MADHAVDRGVDNRKASLVVSVIAPSLLALILGSSFLGLRPLWLDELITVSRVENGLGSLFAETWDLPLLPYYLLTYVWTLGGYSTSDAFVRALSVLLVVLAVLLTSLALGRRYGAMGAFLGGTILAIAPSVAYYSQEARAYALGLALVSVCTYTFMASLARQQQGVWWQYTGSLALSAIFMQQALMVLVIHPVVLLVLPGAVRPRLRSWLISVAAALPFMLLATLLLLGKGAAVHGWVTAPELEALTKTPNLITRSATLGLLLVSLAVLSREGFAWIAGVAAAALSIWLVSVSVASFWLEGTLTLLMPATAIAAAATLSSVGWRYALAWLGVVLSVTLPQTYAVVSRTEEGRFSRQLVKTVVESGITTLKVTDPRFAFVTPAAMRHYAPDFPAVYADADAMVSPPYWLVGGGPCPGGTTISLTTSVSLTRCPY